MDCGAAAAGVPGTRAWWSDFDICPAWRGMFANVRIEGPLARLFPSRFLVLHEDEDGSRKRRADRKNCH
jgi:hypothetical protein